LPHAQDFDRFVLFIDEVVDQERRVDQLAHACPLRYAPVGIRKALEHLNVRKESFAKVVGEFGKMLPGVAEDLLEVC